jgi:hypothetical protein
VKPISEIIADRILATVLELGSMVLADPALIEEVRGMHSLQLMRLLTVARPIPPPDAEIFLVSGAETDLEELPMAAPRIEPIAVPQLKKIKPRKDYGSKDRPIFTAAA